MRVAVPIRIPEQVCVVRRLCTPEARLAAVRHRARQSVRALALFAGWLLVSWLGPDLLPSYGWSVGASLGAGLGYSVWTVGAMVALLFAAGGWMGDRLARQAVRLRLGSAALPVLAGGVAGLIVARALSDQPVPSAWLGTATGLATVVAIVALVCRHEHLRLRQLLGRSAPARGDQAAGRRLQ